jgi:hypothetical protein
MMGCVNFLLRIASAEFIFRVRGLANGSGVIVLRSLWVASWVTGLFVVLAYWTSAWFVSGTAAPGAANATIESVLFWINSVIAWFGAVFGFTYAGLYSRFASQWAYLADLYNSIKRAQFDKALAPTQEASSAGLAAAMADMKHAFVEDAVLLHLACKESFCVAVASWLQDPAVKQAIVDEASDGLAAYGRLFSDACDACTRIGKKVPTP